MSTLNTTAAAFNRLIGSTTTYSTIFDSSSAYTAWSPVATNTMVSPNSAELQISTPQQVLTLVSINSYPRDAALETLRYQDVSQALSELQENGQWKMDAVVYGASVQVAAILMDKNIPTPEVFAHGPKSVVFNWTGPKKNLYLTVSANRISALLSTEHNIVHRAEIAGPEFNYTDSFVSALIHIPWSGTDEPNLSSAARE